MKVVKGSPAGWGECYRTSLLDSYTQTLSNHNSNIAVGSQSGDIIVLNSITGNPSAVLSGHTGAVNCVTFSSDGWSLVSGSWDKTVKLWDIQTGGVVKTFFGHTQEVWSVFISANQTMIASGSGDKTICFWSIQTGECYHTTQQQETVYHIVFSLEDPQHLISISDQKVWQWDANDYQIRPPFNGAHVALSSDGAQFVSCFEQTITVYDSSTGSIFTEFQAAGSAHLCCFSPDDHLVAVAVGEAAYCWDITASEPQLVETFIAHTQKITSLVFSSSTTLVSASYDKSVRFWQVGAQPADPPIIGLKPTPLPSASIKSITLQSEEGIAITSDSNGVIKAWDISTGICKESFQTPAKGPCTRDTRLVNGRLIFVWHTDGKIYAQNTENGELLWEVFWHSVGDLRISGDGLRVFGLLAPSIWAWSLQTGEVVGKVEIGYEGPSVSLVVDGSKVWAYWPQSNYSGWDFGISGSTPMELSKISTLPSHNRLWDPEQAGVKDLVTGGFFFQLSGRFAHPVGVQCDGSYLVAGYQPGEILILDLTNVK